MPAVEGLPVRHRVGSWLRRLTAVVAGAVLALAPVGSVGPAAAAGPGSVTGIVTDANDVPLAGIAVDVIANNGAIDPIGTDVTDATGAYRIDELDPDPYHVVRFSDPTGAYATEYYRDSVSRWGATWVEVAADELTTLGPASLVPGHSISGRLTRVPGEPVPQGNVTLWWQTSPGGWASVSDHVTDADGRWTIPGLRSGTYALLFHDAYTGASEVWDDQPDVMSITPVVVGADDLTGLDAELGGYVVNVAVPTISGTPLVGRVLTASTGRWQPSDTTVTYRWVVGEDTSPFDDPTGPTYVPTAADVGRTIRVEATGSRSRAGWIPATAWSAATSAVSPLPVAPPASLVSDRLPRLKGTLRVGRTMRVTTGDWTPYPRNLTFTWYAGGTRIAGAVHRRFRLKPAQLGKRLVVRVTASAPGYESLTVRTRRSDRVRR